MFRFALLVVFLIATGAAQAQDIDLHGYVQGSLLRSPGDLGASDGGTGKLRWGGTDPRLQPAFGGALVEATAALPLDLSALVDLSLDPQQKSALDLFDASLAWHPAATGDWRWSARLGAFFPPFGLENRDIGWSSPWTLTPSTLAGWIGQELRTVGSEANVTWHIGPDRIALTAALYGWNDVAGDALAARGWDLGRAPSGLFDQVRLPNRGGVPAYTPEFKEIDDTPGWYAGLSWDNPSLGHLQLFRYDNDADPTAARADTHAWHTRFWQAAYSRGFGAFYVLAEGIVGDTAVSPNGAGPFVTDFHSVYVLGGWTRGDWRAALRLEQFGTEGAEHGRAMTTALTYAPRDWLRLTAEIVVVDATSRVRARAGLSPHATDTQPQIGARLSF